MSAELKISRRAFAGGLALLALRKGALAQGFAGLGERPDGFAPVVPGKIFSFPSDHGAHPDFRIEWWYVTANLMDAGGSAYGAQWTLFRQGMRPGGEQEGWASRQLWMGHAAVTSSRTHRFAETFARGGVGQAGVEAKPFAAWIDAWEMRGSDQIGDTTISPLDLKASGADFSYALHLTADRPLILQGDGGYSKKSEREQASYYYSQPFFEVTGNITIDNKQVDVTGQAWMDREWSSQPLALGSNRLGLVRATFQSRRKADAVPDAPDRRPSLRVRQMDLAGRPDKANRIRRHRHDAESTRRDPRPKTPGRLACCDPFACTVGRVCCPQCEELDGHRLLLLGRTDQFFGQPRRRGLSGDDGLLICPDHRCIPIRTLSPRPKC